LHHAVDYTPYEGQRLRAWPGVTIAGGEVVWDGSFHPRAGKGRFLLCGSPSLFPQTRPPTGHALHAFSLPRHPTATLGAAP
jgi:dihydropyrimidinase